ncbi:hypothetical protein ACFWIQ_36290 [Kitasatospora sp. NPDC127059]
MMNADQQTRQAETDDWPFDEDPCSASPSCPCDWHDRPAEG